MLQDFNFKILHRLGLKHTNVDALGRIQWDQPRMMMTSMRKFMTLEVYELTHTEQKIISFLFKLARVQNGLVLRDKGKGFHNIMNVVLASTTSVIPKIINSICLMLYQRMINTRSLLHMLRKLKWEILREVRF